MRTIAIGSGAFNICNKRRRRKREEKETIKIIQKQNKLLSHDVITFDEILSLTLSDLYFDIICILWRECCELSRFLYHLL